MQRFPAGMRIATPVCALARNDMQKEGRVRGCKGVAHNAMQKEGRVRGCKDVARNAMLKEEACQRLQGVVRNAMQKTGTRNRQFPNLLE